MTTTSPDPADFRSPTPLGEGPSSEPRGPARSRWQVGLRSLLLLMAVAGAWAAYVANRVQIPQVQRRIDVLSPLVRELKIDDLTQVAAVLLEPRWYDEHRWQIYLPEGEYRVCLATRQIGQADFPAQFVHVPLPAGQQLLELKRIPGPDPDKKVGRISVWLNDRELVGIDETPDWHANNSSVGGCPFSECTQFPVAKPITLFRRQYMTPGPNGSEYKPNQIGDGILVWIEPNPQ